MAATGAEQDSGQRFAPLLTERLRLRPLAPSDAPDLFRLINDFEVAKQLARVPFPYPRDLADEWILETRRGLEAGTSVHLAIEGRDDPVLLGGIGVSLDPASREGELGYWIARRFWGHGVASEAASRMASWALANLDITRIVARAATDNPASHRVLEKAGFVAEGEGESFCLARGEARAVKVFAASRTPARAPVATEGAAPTRPTLLVAAVALIDEDGRVLLARRPEGKALAGLWEFPGGKVAQGETPEAALIRELREELGIDVATSCLAPFAFASHAYEKFHLLMPLFLCRRWQGRPTGLEGQALAWVAPARLADYAMPPADRPLVAMLRDFL
jgi:8-oxo-dGTP diphosphatase